MTLDASSEHCGSWPRVSWIFDDSEEAVFPGAKTKYPGTLQNGHPLDEDFAPPPGDKSAGAELKDGRCGRPGTHFHPENFPQFLEYVGQKSRDRCFERGQ